jgi:hypothetical protein
MADYKKVVHRWWLKTETKMMKLKVQFCSETRFDQPIRRITRPRVQWSPGIRVLSRTLAMDRRPKLIKPELTGEICPEDSSP